MNSWSIPLLTKAGLKVEPTYNAGVVTTEFRGRIVAIYLKECRTVPVRPEIIDRIKMYGK